MSFAGGWLEVICGPMFSGKSEELIRRVRRAEIARQAVRVVKPAVDDRFPGSDVVAHSGARWRAVPVSSAEALRPLARQGVQVAGIDEAQFFGADLVGEVERLLAAGLRVIVAGLDRDYRGLPFGPMPELLARADEVDKLHAVCHVCGGPATMTQRLLDGRPAPFSGETVLVGGLDTYEARCRRCYEPGADARAGAA